VIRFIDESVQAPEATTTSRSARRSVSAPQEPTRTTDCTSYSLKSSWT
jgi:hypothetical protein